MDPILQKFGLFSAKKTFQTSRKKSRSPTKFSSAKIKTFVNDDIDSQDAIILSKMISLLNSLSIEKCRERGHQKNYYKYLCFNENCSQKIGCSHCFLNAHKDHPKHQIAACLREIKDLKRLTDDYNKKICGQRVILRNNVMKEIDEEIQNICKEFHHNLQFLKNKTVNEIDRYLFDTFKINQVAHSSTFYNNKQALFSSILTLNTSQIEKDLEEKLRNIEFEKINMKIMPKFFQEMNGALSHFLATFKSSHPHLYDSKRHVQQFSLPPENSQRQQKS